MKRFLSIAMILALMCSIFCFSVNAEPQISHATYPADEQLISQTMEQQADGSYILITVSQKVVSTRSYRTSGTKTYSGINKDGVVMWQFMVHGSFTFSPGVNSTCTSVSHSYKISDSAWQYDSGSSHKYGNRAIGNGKFIRKILFVTVETRECEVTLTCDNNGNLS